MKPPTTPTSGGNGGGWSCSVLAPLAAVLLLIVTAVNTAGYLWAHRYGRLALLCTTVGVIGLVFHFWTGIPLLAALPTIHPTAPQAPGSVHRRSTVCLPGRVRHPHRLGGAAPP
jgi:hypothetical protein